MEVKMWFKKEITLEEAIKCLEERQAEIDNRTAERLMVIIIKSGANKVTHFRVEE